MLLEVKQKLKHRMAISYPPNKLDNMFHSDYSRSWHLAKYASMSYLQLGTTHKAINFCHFQVPMNILTTPNNVYRPSACRWELVLRGLCVVFNLSTQLSKFSENSQVSQAYRLSIAFIIIYNCSPPCYSRSTNYSGDQCVSLNVILRLKKANLSRWQ